MDFLGHVKIVAELCERALNVCRQYPTHSTRDLELMHCVSTTRSSDEGFVDEAVDDFHYVVMTGFESNSIFCKPSRRKRLQHIHGIQQ